MITAAMGAIVAHNRANQCGGLSLTTMKQKYTVRTRRYVPLSELSYCLHNAEESDSRVLLVIGVAPHRSGLFCVAPGFRASSEAAVAYVYSEGMQWPCWIFSA